MIHDPRWRAIPQSLASAAVLCAFISACDRNTPSPTPRVNTFSPAQHVLTAALTDSIPYETESSSGTLHRVVVHHQNGADTLPQVLTAERPVVVGDSEVYVFRYDSIGTLRGAVRYRVGRPLDILSVPVDLNAALSGFALSADGAYLAYVRFPGDSHGIGIVRTWPAGQVVRETAATVVTEGDSFVGSAAWSGASSFEFFFDVFGDTTGRWLRLRGSLGQARIVGDTVTVTRGH